MLLKNQSFKINEFRIPEFTLRQGEMTRFWVEIIPISKSDTNGYWVAKEVQKFIRSNYQEGIKVKVCSPKVKRKLLEHIKPFTAGEYLKSRYNFSTETEIENLILQFGIKPEYKIKHLGTAHQKVFSIICEFQKDQIVLFDYYGLSLDAEEQLTTFVKQELSKGKSAISFDNLYYKPQKVDSDKIVNLDIRRERKHTN